MTIILIALPFYAHAIDHPEPAGYINDLANVIRPETTIQLANIITQFERATGNELAVVTVPSLEDEPIENYAAVLFEKWGVGKKGEDNGLLFVIAPVERKARIEVGYGLEPYINDALAGRILRDTMFPHFKSGDFSQGILNGVVEATGIIAKKTGVQFDPATAGQVDTGSIYHLASEGPDEGQPLIVKILKVIAVIIIVLFFLKNPWAALFMLSSLGGGGRGGSYRGGFGGGFGGFGGGSSGGGGASGSW
jgi:uncharacterized protein